MWWVKLNVGTHSTDIAIKMVGCHFDQKKGKWSVLCKRTDNCEATIEHIDWQLWVFCRIKLLPDCDWCFVQLSFPILCQFDSNFLCLLQLFLHCGIFSLLILVCRNHFSCVTCPFLCLAAFLTMVASVTSIATTIGSWFVLFDSPGLFAIMWFSQHWLMQIWMGLLRPTSIGWASKVHFLGK